MVPFFAHFSPLFVTSVFSYLTSLSLSISLYLSTYLSLFLFKELVLLTPGVIYFYLMLLSGHVVTRPQHLVGADLDPTTVDVSIS